MQQNLLVVADFSGTFDKNRVRGVPERIGTKIASYIDIHIPAGAGNPIYQKGEEKHGQASISRSVAPVRTGKSAVAVKRRLPH